MMDFNGAKRVNGYGWIDYCERPVRLKSYDEFLFKAYAHKANTIDKMAARLERFKESLENIERGY